MKTVLFIPGFKEDLSSRDYAATLSAIKSKGYKVEFVPIDWQRTTLKSWVTQVKVKYAKHDPSETILAGFSYGAMTALQLASEDNPSEVWLFSLSPYYSDDMPNMKKAWLKLIGKNRADEFRKLDFNDIAARIECPVLLVAGETEMTKYPDLGNRVKVANTIFKDSKLVTVPNVGHDVAHPDYIAAIKRSIDNA